jgi:hypothetical protein
LSARHAETSFLVVKLIPVPESVVLRATTAAAVVVDATTDVAAASPDAG